MQMYSRHQATCQLLALTLSGHTAHVPATGLFQKPPETDAMYILPML